MGLLASCPNAPKSLTWLDWSLDTMELLNIVPAKQALFLCWLIFLIGGHEGTWLEVQPIRNVRQSCYISFLHEPCTRHILLATREKKLKKLRTASLFIDVQWCSSIHDYATLHIQCIYSNGFSVRSRIHLMLRHRWIKIPTPWGGVSRVHAEADGTRVLRLAWRGLQDILRGWESDQRYVFSIINDKYDCFQWQPQYPHFIPLIFWSCDPTLGLVLDGFTVWTCFVGFLKSCFCVVARWCAYVVAWHQSSTILMFCCNQQRWSDESGNSLYFLIGTFYSWLA